MNPITIIIATFAIVLFAVSVRSLSWRAFGVGIDGSLWKKYDPLKKIPVWVMVLVIMLSLILLLLVAFFG
jgi:hypothetical protein